MSWEFFTVTYPVARKDFLCDAMEFISYYSDNDFTKEELSEIEKARAEGSKILKGTRYKKVTGKWDGEFCVFRARPEIDAICIFNDIYPDD